MLIHPVCLFFRLVGYLHSLILAELFIQIYANFQLMDGREQAHLLIIGKPLVN